MISFIALHVCACQVLHIVDFPGSRRMETAPTSIEVLLRPTQGQPDEPSDLRGYLSPTTRHRCTMSYSVYGTWQSQVVTHPIMNRARRCLASVIKPTQFATLCNSCCLPVRFRYPPGARFSEN